MQALDLGISQDELREQVVDRATERLVEYLVNEDEARESIASVVQRSIDAMTERVASESVEPLVREKIEGVVLQKTNQWGEPKGEGLTFVEYLVQRAEAYLVEPVNHRGETKEECRGHWSYKESQKRIAWMIDQHLQYSIKSAMEAALKTANENMAQGIAETVKIKLREVSEALKVSVKT